jgi:hypothetical protein
MAMIAEAGLSSARQRGAVVLTGLPITGRYQPPYWLRMPDVARISTGLCARRNMIEMTQGSTLISKPPAFRILVLVMRQ